MEIKVNDYVRTDNGYIVKIDEEKKNLQMLKFLDVEYGNIVKHSNNIIDLIEVGDYVNGKEIIKIDKQENSICYGYRYKDEARIWSIYNEDIKSVLTKEQFSSLEYII